jgi:hypothetical protein
MEVVLLSLDPKGKENHNEMERDDWNDDSGWNVGCGAGEGTGNFRK